VTNGVINGLLMKLLYTDLQLLNRYPTVLKDEDRLESLSAKVKQRALAWDEVAYGEKLLEIMTRVSA
jgi:hypothetical protein